MITAVPFTEEELAEGEQDVVLFTAEDGSRPDDVESVARWFATLEKARAERDAMAVRVALLERAAGRCAAGDDLSMRIERCPLWTWVRGSCEECGYKVTLEMSEAEASRLRSWWRALRAKLGGYSLRWHAYEQVRRHFRKAGCPHVEG